MQSSMMSSFNQYFPSQPGINLNPGQRHVHHSQSSIQLGNANFGSKNYGQMIPDFNNQHQQDVLNCQCGQVIRIRDIENHISICNLMQQNFGYIWTQLKIQYDNCQKIHNHQRTFQAILQYFSEKISADLNNGSAMIQQTSRMMMNQPQPSLPNNNLFGFTDSNVQMNMNQSFSVVDVNRGSGRNSLLMNSGRRESNKKPFNLLTNSIYEINREPEVANQQNQVQNQVANQVRYEEQKSVYTEDKCSKCQRAFTREEELQCNKLAIETCFHFIHKKCFIEIVYEQYPRTQVTLCPEKGCSGQIQEYEIKGHLTQEQQNEIEKMVQKNILESCNNMISCKCGNMMEMQEGVVDYSQRDDLGNQISKEAAEHMSRFRARCNQCSNVFCTSCKEEPYHIGKTCEQFKKFKNQKKCRFCSDEIVGLSQSQKPAFQDVCRSEQCQELMAQSCDKKLRCGHYCCGFHNEPQCLPCLHPDCVKQNQQATLGQDWESYCTICYVQGLGAKPCVKLECGHIFHLDCVMSILNKGWPGPRIVFNFLNCTTCKQRIRASYCAELTQRMKQVEAIESDIMKKALERGKYEGIDKHERLRNQTDRFYNNLQQYCMEKLSYYECFKCKAPYFGGMKDCERQNEEVKEYRPDELVCGKCSAQAVGAGLLNCKKHGLDYIEFKCKFCCNIAQWFCWGNTHFCEPCHTRQNNGDYVSRKKQNELPQCPGPEKCPLGIKHPQNGQEYALGCALCKNERANQNF